MQAVVELLALDLGRDPGELGVLDPELRPLLAERVGREEVEAVERSAPGAEFAELWEEMTMVRRSAPVGAQW